MIRLYSKFSTEKQVVLSFLLLIFGGAFLLWFCNLSYHPLHPLDALFTATSAVCVTGLIVVDTAKDLSPLSRAVVLVLLQLGGLGVITASLALTVARGKRVGIRSRLLFVSTMGKRAPRGAIRLLFSIIKFTVAAELVGALCLFPFFLKKMPFMKAWAFAFFHSASAFCNAGFSLFSTNLEAYQTSLVVPGTIMALIVMGGLGFPVWIELRVLSFRSWRRLSVGSRLVIASSLLLIVFGAVAITLLEWNHSFTHLSPWWKIWNGLFASVTARTAGFDTVPLGLFSSTGLMIMILLMIVGASPSSTGGGVKNTTVAVVGLAVGGEVRGSQDTNLWGRRIPFSTIRRALVLLVLYLGTLLVGVILLSVLEPFSFRNVAFEVTSALGTVGLSTGITGELSPLGKALLIIFMFWGRVGILTFMSVVILREDGYNYTYPAAEITLG